MRVIDSPMTLLPSKTRTNCPFLFISELKPSSLSTLFGHMSTLPTHMVYLLPGNMFSRLSPTYSSYPCCSSMAAKSSSPRSFDFFNENEHVSARSFYLVYERAVLRAALTQCVAGERVYIVRQQVVFDIFYLSRLFCRHGRDHRLVFRGYHLGFRDVTSRKCRL